MTASATSTAATTRRAFSLIEPMLKLSFEPSTALKQRLEFKAGYSSLEADETYTGLIDADLARAPDRRYAACLAASIGVLVRPLPAITWQASRRR